MSALVTPRVLIFDLYGTLIDIRTRDHSRRAWQHLATVLRYWGIAVEATRLHSRYRTAVRQQLDSSREAYPEFDVIAAFQTTLQQIDSQISADQTRRIAQLYRVLTRRRFALFPDVLPALQQLQTRYRLALLSDAQRLFLEPELAEAGLSHLFDVVAVSSDYGYRKPDPRLFQHVLDRLNCPAQHALMIGDHLWRDVCGAQAVGISGIWLRRPNAISDNATCAADHVMNTLDVTILNELSSG